MPNFSRAFGNSPARVQWGKIEGSGGVYAHARAVKSFSSFSLHVLYIVLLDSLVTKMRFSLRPAQYSCFI